MEIDAPHAQPGDEADVESEGGSIRQNRKSHSPKESKGTPKPESSNKKEAIEILDDDDDAGSQDENDEDADEETFAVEKVLNHRIGKKANVSSPHCLRVSSVLTQ